MGQMRNAYKSFIGRDNLEYLGVNITTNLRETGWKGVYCIQLAQDRVQWQTFVDTAMNRGVSSLPERLVDLQEELCPMEFVN
jgi:hypothetical protein